RKLGDAFNFRRSIEDCDAIAHLLAMRNEVVPGPDIGEGRSCDDLDLIDRVKNIDAFARRTTTATDSAALTDIHDPAAPAAVLKKTVHCMCQWSAFLAVANKLLDKLRPVVDVDRLL